MFPSLPGVLFLSFFVFSLSCVCCCCLLVGATLAYCEINKFCLVVMPFVEIVLDVEAEAQKAVMTESYNSLHSVITFRKLSYLCDVKPLTPFSCKKTASKQILYDLSGSFRPGLNAIIGSTGSGKTTLLNALAGRLDVTGLNGEISLNGMMLPKAFKYLVGYVVQNDMLMGTLTVKENLWFSANLRLPRTVPFTEKKEVVKRVISQLGLTSCENSRIGNDFIRGVSGGERKRTAIGMELIIRPSILFLDEPTSGLDASTAFAVVMLLKSLSAEGRTIVMTIHQPRYSIFRLFDSLTLLGKGYMVYHGPVNYALSYFCEIGYECEEHENPADFLLDVACGNNSFDQAQLQSDGKKINDDQLLCHIKNLSTKFLNSSICKEIIAEVDASRDKRCDEIDFLKKSDNLFCYEFWILSRRAFKNLVRNPMACVGNIILNLLIGIVFGLLYYQVDNSTTTGVQNRFGVLFFICTNLMFGTISAIEIFFKERAIFIHEQSLGYYRISAYFLAKLMADLIPIRTFCPLVFSLITYWMVGLKRSLEAFLIFFLTVILVVYAATATGMFYSATFGSFAVASVFISLTFIFSIIFAGLLVNVDTVLPWLSWIKYISIARYGYSALCINELEGQIFKSCFSLNETSPVLKYASVAKLTFINNQSCITVEGEEFLGHRLALALDDNGKLSDWQLWQNHVALGSIVFGMLFLTYIQLVRLSKKTWG